MVRTLILGLIWWHKYWRNIYNCIFIFNWISTWLLQNSLLGFVFFNYMLHLVHSHFLFFMWCITLSLMTHGNWGMSQWIKASVPVVDTPCFQSAHVSYCHWLTSSLSLYKQPHLDQRSVVKDDYIWPFIHEEISHYIIILKNRKWNFDILSSSYALLFTFFHIKE